MQPSDAERNDRKAHEIAFKAGYTTLADFSVATRKWKEENGVQMAIAERQSPVERIVLDALVHRGEAQFSEGVYTASEGMDDAFARHAEQEKEALIEEAHAIAEKAGYGSLVDYAAKNGIWERDPHLPKDNYVASYGYQKPDTRVVLEALCHYHQVTPGSGIHTKDFIAESMLKHVLNNPPSAQAKIER